MKNSALRLPECIGWGGSLLVVMQLIGCGVLPVSKNLRGGYGVVISSGGSPGASQKEGVQGVTDTGRSIFGFSRLEGKPDIGTSAYIGGSIPQWVRVTWREGDFIQDFKNAGWKGGVIVGDYTISVASRIPQEVLDYANARSGRVVKLTFRVADDGVLLGWGVQHSYGMQLIETLHGGDFPCTPDSEIRKKKTNRPQCISGYLHDAPWYRTDMYEE